jgi:signal transduction histidine kinase
LLEHALMTQEVRAVAVYDRTGKRLAISPPESPYARTLPEDCSPDDLNRSAVQCMSSGPNHWLLAARIDKESTPNIIATPTGFEIVPSEQGGEPLGTVCIYWDLVPSSIWLAEFQSQYLAFSAVAFVIVGVPTWLFTVYLSRGLKQLLVATQHVQCGNFNHRINSDRQDELGDVMRGFDCMIARTAETTRQMQEERARALDASKAKSEFLANMSHELRTPLNAVVGFSELLLEPKFGALNDKQKLYVTDVLESGRHLLSLINDILDLAKIESGRMSLEPTKFDLPYVLSSCTRLISERAARHDLRLCTEVEKGLKTIVADERKLKQLVFNLLSNAVKFTPNGGQVGIRAWKQGHAVRLCVWDTGIGISESEHAKIFEEFYQVENSQVKRHQGTGLGLALVKKICELHGGRVWVESAAEKGSRFMIELPQPSEQLGQVA